jgi:hypothetical protein
LGELQARWAVKVYTGQVALPSTDAMLTQVRTREAQQPMYVPVQTSTR